MSAQLNKRIQKLFVSRLPQNFGNQKQILILMDSKLHLKIKNNEQTIQARFILTSHYFSIEYAKGDRQYAKIEFALKFQTILQNQNIFKSRKIGFRLTRADCDQFIQFYHNDSQVVQKWINMLKTKVNQLGFHQYFKAIRKIGKGQFATVFEVQNLISGHKFAVKGFSKLSLSKIPKGWESLINQIKIMRSFSHKNLQKLDCVYQTQNSIYLVTELLKGGTLFDRLQQLIRERKKLDIENARNFMKGIFDGLEQLCRLQIVHRDLKLDNIILRDRQSFQPVIIDFGLATFVDEPQYIYYRCGTPGFVSPQVMNSTPNQKIQPISDIFSAGVIFHYILTQKSIFNGTTAEEVLKSNKDFIINFESQMYDQIDLQAMKLLQKMMIIDPSKRIKASEALINQFFGCFTQTTSPFTTSICQSQKFIVDQLKF